MKKIYVTFLLFGLCICFVQAQTTHVIDWELGVGGDATITIDAGDTVEWTNVDIGMPHDVTSSDPDAPAGFGSATLGDMDTYSFTFDDPVVFDYGCGIHPGSMDGTITVLGSADCNAPEGLSVNSVTDSTVEFFWDPSPDETDGYDWVIMDTGDDPETDTPVDQGTVSSGLLGAEATGLAPNTTYEAYVKTNCDGGLASDFSDALSITTAEDCPEVTDLTVLDVTDTTMTFSWTEPDNTEIIENGYGVIIVLEGNTIFEDDHVLEDNVDVGNSAAMADGLQPDTTFDLYMVTVCSAEPQILSDFVMTTFTTDETLLVEDHETLDFSFYPNPTTDVINLQASDAIRTVKMYTLHGQKVKSQQFNQRDGQLDVADLAKGVYLLTADFENGASRTVKIVKQ